MTDTSLKRNKDWCLQAAKREGDAEVGAGFETIPADTSLHEISMKSHATDTSLVERLEGKPLSTEPFPSDIIAKLEAALRERDKEIENLRSAFDRMSTRFVDQGNLRQRIAELETGLKAIDEHRLYVPERQAYVELKQIARSLLSKEP